MVIRISARGWVVGAASLWLSATAQAQTSEIAGKRALVKATPRDASAQQALGIAELRAGHFPEAKRAFEAAASLSKGDPRAVMHVAEVALAQGDYKAAKNLCRKLFPQRGTPSPIAHVCMARAYLAWNRSSRAFDDLKEALTIDPNCSEAQLVLGHAHRLRAQVAEASAAYTKAKQDPSLEAEANLGLGKLYAAAGKKAEAMAALRETLSREGTWPEAQLELGLLLSSTEEGRGLLAAALAGRPGWTEAARALGDARRDASDFAGAESAYREALKSDPKLAPALAGLGEVLFKSGRLDDAQVALEKSLTLVTNNARAALVLAEVLAQQNKIDEAVEQFRHATDLDPRNPTGLVRAAEILLAAQRATLAAGFLDRLLEAHPELAQGLALYGDAMLQRGDKPAAKGYYTRALKGQGTLKAEERARIQNALAGL